MIHQNCILNFRLENFPWDLQGKTMKAMKGKSAMESVKTENTLKFTKTKSAEPSHQRKPRAITNNFKTTERHRMYSRAYHKKIADVKRFGGCNPEEAKELARAYAKEVLMHNRFSVHGWIITIPFIAATKSHRKREPPTRISDELKLVRAQRTRREPSFNYMSIVLVETIKKYASMQVRVVCAYF